MKLITGAIPYSFRGDAADNDNRCDPHMTGNAGSLTKGMRKGQKLMSIVHGFSTIGLEFAALRR